MLEKKAIQLFQNPSFKIYHTRVDYVGFSLASPAHDFPLSLPHSAILFKLSL